LDTGPKAVRNHSCRPFSATLLATIPAAVVIPHRG
jgi:hypothetical protein